MFNRKKIETLKWQVTDLQADNVRQQEQIWQLRADLETLLKYLCVEFVNVKERRVQAVKPYTEVL